jgi:hypothetical protein
MYMCIHIDIYIFKYINRFKYLIHIFTYLHKYMYICMYVSDMINAAEGSQE